MTDEENNKFEGAIFEMYDNPLEFAAGKTIDLVRYTDTHDRVVLGKAEVLANGSFRMRIGDDRVKEMFEGQLSSFSISAGKATGYVKSIMAESDTTQKMGDDLIRQLRESGMTIEEITKKYFEND